MPRTDERPRTLFEKIVARHALATELTSADPAPGDGAFVRADWRFIHEYYTGMAAHILHATFGRPLALHDPATIVVFEDHTSYVEESPTHVRGGLMPNLHCMVRAQRDFVAAYALRSHRTLTEAEAAAENAVLGANRRTPQFLLPAGGFTDPDYAGVGFTQEQARERDPQCVVASVPFSNLDRAVIDDRDHHSRTAFEGFEFGGCADAFGHLQGQHRLRGPVGVHRLRGQHHQQQRDPPFHSHDVCHLAWSRHGSLLGCGRRARGYGIHAVVSDGGGE